MGWKYPICHKTYLPNASPKVWDFGKRSSLGVRSTTWIFFDEWILPYIYFLFFPSSVHIYITPMHTQDGIKERFVNDLSCVTDELLRQPRAKMEGRVKSSFSEKATKNWKKYLTCFDTTEWKQLFCQKGGRFFQILWPSHNVLTLNNKRSHL